jgi:hypothetical protein
LSIACGFDVNPPVDILCRFTQLSSSSKTYWKINENVNKIQQWKNSIPPIQNTIRDRYVSQRKKSRDFKNKNIVKPAPYDGKGPWIDYKSHFDTCAQINEWSQKEKGLYLAVSLRGQAKGVLGNLPFELRQDYKELVKSLEERFPRRIRLSCVELS